MIIGLLCLLGLFSRGIATYVLSLLAFLTFSIALGRYLFALIPSTPTFYNTFFIFEVVTFVTGRLVGCRWRLFQFSFPLCLLAPVYSGSLRSRVCLYWCDAPPSLNEGVTRVDACSEDSIELSACSDWFGTCLSGSAA